jgi:hypothetical protein
MQPATRFPVGLALAPFAATYHYTYCTSWNGLEAAIPIVLENLPSKPGSIVCQCGTGHLTKPVVAKYVSSGNWRRQ